MKRIFNKIKEIIFKIKDYDRLEHNYIKVMCNATFDTLSKSSYEPELIINIIDEKQSEFYYGIVKTDMSNMIKDGASIEDIKNYIENL